MIELSVKTGEGIDLLKQAVKERGVQVQLMMDDDVILGNTEVPGATKFYKDNLAPKKSGLDIRFVRTNEDAKQMMHSKFLILDGVGKKGVKRVFSGAGHFTYAAMKGNYENFYLSAVPSLTQKYEQLHKYMWTNAVSEKDLEE
ncbi:MAG: phospholipase D family protein [Deltaproteobacteria bacterium]|nr:phospholipase D family protein [Deltaproteobacteria bacterium]